MKIRSDPVLQADRLPDVDNRPLGIFHQVTAGFGWQGIQGTLNVFRYVHRTNFITLCKTVQKAPKNIVSVEIV